VLLSYADAFRALGLHDPNSQKLGRGKFGHVYRLGPEHAPTGALKITRDVYDALASFSLIGRNFSHLPQTQNVWALAETFIDDWAGWYDHVFPPQIDEDGYGPRVPTLIISPYAKEGYIDSTTYDFTSILAFIETVFDLPPLVPGGRDATANNLMQAFDFTAPPRTPVIPRGEYPMKTLAEERSPFIVSAMYGGILSFAVFLPFAVWLLPRWIRTRGSKSTF